jgi:hypothetical protein
MSRYCGDRNPDPIFKAAAHWRDVALLGQGAIFGSNKLWTVANLKAIDENVSQNPDTGKDDFLGKLKVQLASCTAEVKQLAAEIMWLMFLAPSNVKPKRKREVISTIWEWSGVPFSTSGQWLTDEVLSGIGSGGRSFNTLRWRELVFCVNAVLSFRALAITEQQRIVADGGEFAKWLQSITDANNRQLRHMLLYLLFPDQFERIFSAGDRLEIVTAFGGKTVGELKNKTAYEIDSLLADVRAAAEKAHGTKDLDFYLKPLDSLWGDTDEKLNKIEQQHVEAAIARIEEEGIPPKDQSKKYDLLYRGNRYPIKLVASIAAEEATGATVTRGMFPSGEGGTAFKRLEQLGFEIVEKNLIRDLVEKFLAQPTNDLTTKQYEKSYRGLQIRVSFGQGASARVPWIALIASGQKVSDGMYPVVLNYRDAKLLIVAYGMSEENDAAGSWRGLQGKGTIRALQESQYSRTPERYGDSFVEASYDLNQPLDTADLTKHLDLVIDAYRNQQFGNAGNPNATDDVQSETDMPLPKNLIYYGPPGTGKTYKTAEKAVLLCDGKSPEGGRPALMTRYRELLAAQRINFVTFHQSYSYEDFVEGLRPDLDEEGGSDAKQGLRLSVQAGVFKAIADRAAAGRGATSTVPTDIEKHGAFKMSLGRAASDDDAYLFQEATEGGYVLLGYGGDIDWSDDRYAKFSAILSKWQERDPAATGNNPNVTQIFTLRNEMKEGDFVIISDGNKRFRAIGTIDGPYKFVGRERDTYHHQRKVKWLWKRPEGLPREEIYGKQFSQVSAYRLVSAFVKWPALAQFIASGSSQPDHGAQQPFVLIIDEINRGNISKIFGELITLIEPDKRQGMEEEIRVKLPYSHTEFCVPQNLHIIGTMNTADRSIALLDTALRRRFDFEELAPMPSLISESVQGINVRAAFEGMNNRIEYLYDRDHLIGHAYLQKCSTLDELNEVMRNRIIPLLVEYFYEDWEKVRAVLKETKNDGAFIARAVLSPALGNSSEALGSQERWQYTIKRTFTAADYEQLA